MTKFRSNTLFAVVASLALFAGGSIVPAIAQDQLQIAPVFIVDQYRVNANQGDIRAQFRLGLLHERGLVTGTPNFEEAARWYGLAAQAGHPSAQFKAGFFLANGIGGEMDLPAAIVLYRKAAEQGIAEAQFNLAVLLQEGRGVPQDLDQAIRWFEQASFRGIVPAMRALGLIYLARVETSRDDAIEAWAWLTLALEGGDSLAAGYRADAEAQLNEEARQQAVALSDTYRQLRLNP